MATGLVSPYEASVASVSVGQLDRFRVWAHRKRYQGDDGQPSRLGWVGDQLDLRCDRLGVLAIYVK